MTSTLIKPVFNVVAYGSFFCLETASACLWQERFESVKGDFCPENPRTFHRNRCTAQKFYQILSLIFYILPWFRIEATIDWDTMVLYDQTLQGCQ